MLPLLLAAILFWQNTGTVTGVLKDLEGKPVEGVRMAAVRRSDLPNGAPAGEALSSIAETDSAGRYTLENILPGRYYIAAGRLDKQTYFPGTPDVTAAKEILIVAGQKVQGIDFVLDDTSFGRAFPIAAAGIPLHVSVDDGGPLPLSVAGRMTVVRFSSPVVGYPASISPSITSTFASFIGTQAMEYRVTVENLPATYVVKSITFGSTDLSAGPFRLAPADPTLSAGSLQPLLPVPAAAGAGNSQRPSVLAITLARMAHPASRGVRVSGRLSGTPNERQTVYLSNIPGDLYADGTFEFFGVPPGRHSIVTRDNPRDADPFGGTVVVEGRDLDNVELSEISLVPSTVWQSATRSAGRHPAGNVPLARISGTVVDEALHQPVTEGEVVIKSNGYYTASFPVTADGHFEIPSLLPGIYELEVQVFGHSTVKRSVEIDDEDGKFDLVVRRIRN